MIDQMRLMSVCGTGLAAQQSVMPKAVLLLVKGTLTMAGTIVTESTSFEDETDQKEQ
jgi:hypothetical protein